MRQIIITVVVFFALIGSCKGHGWYPLVRSVQDANKFELLSQNATVLWWDRCCNSDRTICDSDPECITYENSDQTDIAIPLALQFFIGQYTGIGYFILGRNSWGICQAIVFLIWISLKLLIGDQNALGFSIKPHVDKVTTPVAKFIAHFGILIETFYVLMWIVSIIWIMHVGGL